MGKTPKDKHRVERRRPYNYPRNAQAQTQNSGTESRNYSYSTGNVPRKPPIYHSVPYQGVCGPLPNQAYRFAGGRGYRGRLGGINKPLKPVLGKQRRPDLRTRRVLSPRHRPLTRKNMQAEEHDTLQDKNQETSEQILKNGPDSYTPSSEDDKAEGKEKGEKSGEVSNNIESCDSNGIADDTGETAEKIEPKSKRSSSKEKKSKKNSPAAKIIPKGKHSPKSKKESEPETDNQVVEKEKSSNKREESEIANIEPSPALVPSVKILRLDPMQTEMSDTNDSIIEIPIENQDKPEDDVPSMPSTSKEEIPAKTVADVPAVKDSPRRSTRLSLRQTPPPKPKFSEKSESSSIIVLDSDDSVSVLEMSRTSQERSFGQSLRSLSGRPSLRPLPAYKRSFTRPSNTTGSAFIRSNILSKSETTSNDSESDIQDNKPTQSKPGLWGIFHHSPSTNTTSQDSTTDNEESTNRSYADESGNDSEETIEPPFENASNVSFRKRKVDSSEVIEQEHEVKKIKSDSEKNFNSSGLLSIVSSPMNLFASKLRGDKIASSTPVQLLTSDIDDEDMGEEDSKHHDVSDNQYEENISKSPKENDDDASLSEKIEVDQESNPRRWCSIM